MDSALLTRLRQKIAEQQQADVGNVLAGRMRDFTEYRYACGYLKGLNDAVTLAEDILRELHKGD